MNPWRFLVFVLQVKRHAFKRELIAPLGRSVPELWAAVGAAQRLLATDTPTLCHGDAHVANTFCCCGPTAG